jgi:hypothetical protein
MLSYYLCFSNQTDQGVEDTLPPPLVFAQPSPQFKQVLDQFPEVVNPEKPLPPKTKHGVEHHIKVKAGPLISSKFWRLDPEKFAAAKAEFDQLERDGIIRRSESPWASPLHMVKKPNGSWRACGALSKIFEN